MSSTQTTNIDSNDSFTERKGLSRLDSQDLGSKLISNAKSNPPLSPLPSSNPSQGRSNPFRVSSPGKRASGVCGKSFFDSVEEEKKASLQRKSKICEYSLNFAKSGVYILRSLSARKKLHCY